MAIDLNRISTRVRNLMPVTWDAMSSDSRVDDSVLTDPVELACALYLEEDTPSDTTLEALSRVVIEFLAKYAALELTGPAIDYWMEQKESITTTGTNETVTFPNRIKAIENLRAALVEDLAKLEPIVAPLIPVIATRKGTSAPRLSSIEDDLLTPNPQDFGPIYAEKIGQ